MCQCESAEMSSSHETLSAVRRLSHLLCRVSDCGLNVHITTELPDEFRSLRKINKNEQITKNRKLD